MANDQRICSIDGCGKQHKGKGLCATHLLRLRKHGSPHIVKKGGPKRRPPKVFSCKVEGCGADFTVKDGGGNGYCCRHNARFKRYGDPLGGRVDSGTLGNWVEAHKDWVGVECLTWPFAVNRAGYGVLGTGYETRIASRLMCIRAHGEPPSKGMHAAHSCGNGHLGCVNPTHLRWATAKENNADKDGHGRLLRGSDVAGSKLSEAMVRQIRISRGVPYKALAKKFGVSLALISMVRNRKVWRHVE